MPQKKSKEEFKEKAKEEVRAEIEQIHPTETNLLAAISYIWLLCLIPLLFARKNEYVQFHARQGVVLLVLELLLGWFPIFTLIFVVASVIGFVKALQGKKWKMPIVVTILEKVVMNKN